MKHYPLIVACAMLMSVVGTAQEKLTFDVASVRPSNPERIGFGMNGGPGTANPGRLDYLNVPLRRIVQTAYGIMPYELAAPSWMTETRFDITAKIPEGATKEQLRIMIQNLLAERFHLKLHHERRELTAYDLTVGKGGSKLQESDLSRNSQPQPSNELAKMSSDGYPVPFPGRSMVMRFSVGNGTMRMSGGLQTTEQIAQMLTGYVGAQVVDKTGLTGKYDFHLEFAGDDSSDGAGALVPPSDVARDPLPSIFSAVQEQLGLRLDRTKAFFEVLVVDHIEKMPTEN